MRLKYNFLISEVAGRIIAVPENNDFNGYLALNQTGKRILEMLKQETTLEQIISNLKELFPTATEQEIAENATEFLNKLDSENLIEKTG